MCSQDIEIPPEILQWPAGSGYSMAIPGWMPAIACSYFSSVIEMYSLKIEICQFSNFSNLLC